MTRAQLIFVGGGNMASAIVGGLLAAGHAAERILVVEPAEDTRRGLAAAFGVETAAAPPRDSELDAAAIVWAVKPQVFNAAAPAWAGRVGRSLQLSVMAGVRSEKIAAALGSERIVRAMPNMPASIGLGIAGLFARAAVDDAGRRLAEAVLRGTGELLWLPAEDDLDAVTALSGSGPAYVFYLVEAMMQAAAEMGLPADIGKRLATATFAGAAALVERSTESPAALRQRVTSRGGTTHAAIESMEASGVAEAFVRALKAAQRRAVQLGRS